jgi:hypothetical protein
MYICSMAFEPPSTMLTQARDNLVAGCYGQFDLIPALFPLSILLHEKPRQLRRMIAIKLDVPLEQVRYRTFISWLARFRARHASMTVQKGSAMVMPPVQSGPPVDWKAFQASAPERRDPESDVLLSFPTYD